MPAEVWTISCHGLGYNDCRRVYIYRMLTRAHTLPGQPEFDLKQAVYRDVPMRWVHKLLTLLIPNGWETSDHEDIWYPVYLDPPELEECLDIYSPLQLALTEDISSSAGVT